MRTALVLFVLCLVAFPMETAKAMLAVLAVCLAAVLLGCAIGFWFVACTWAYTDVSAYGRGPQ